MFSCAVCIVVHTVKSGRSCSALCVLTKFVCCPDKRLVCLQTVREKLPQYTEATKQAVGDYTQAAREKLNEYAPVVQEKLQTVSEQLHPVSTCVCCLLAVLS